MIKNNTKFKDVFILEPQVFSDERGWFLESYNENKLCELSINFKTVQVNHSFSAYKDTIRGLHFQEDPKSQSKLVRCLSGSIVDVVVDLRKDSLTYLQHEKFYLSAENKKQVILPKGFAHGFKTLSDNVEIEYCVDDFYDANLDRSIVYNDSTFGIEWECEKPILSKKDMNAITYRDWVRGKKI